MESFVFARVLHVLGVVLWIGGVAMVTTILLPAIKRFKSESEQIAFFEKIEGRFALQAKFTTLITGLSGFYMLYYLNAWHRYADFRFWWLHLMTVVWAIFTLILFVLEPLVLHQWFMESAKKNPVKTFRVLQRMHWVLLLLSLITIIGSVAGSHGWFFF